MAIIKPQRQPDFIKAKKSLGQNFCIDERIPEEIIRRLAATSQHQIWEIGPGKGALTTRLTETGAAMQLFEIDDRLREPLTREFPDAKIIWGDFLELPDSALPALVRPLLVCGNLPYYCGTPIIRRFLENGPLAERLVFLLQQEVAIKAAAPVNHREYSFLSLHTAFFARASVGGTYPPSSFAPPPKINSSILILEPLSLNESERQRRFKALKFASFLFNQRRKMALPLLRRQFKDTDWDARFALQGIDAKARPENISPDQMLELFAPLED
ncbi:MAG TPA: 16S rRNA (adenine(1518)-N(6)/adenine(1519)-N(6))-dimethyltransferase RsmA [Candidatus Rifleibacterium sp.]|nr:16S rRNA (adenine(1518)-N(6)/adenine(1519)-N(6))-dimethyltransferase RsmA [Candidatus Rifleibacterium sp.]HPT46270.1 16S rRNA (adenine(1518)-N(6)/adenine(1519)-N(6))-dimethyltransferase RsmA [Candidatus Rifleibacterium sp.]